MKKIPLMIPPTCRVCVRLFVVSQEKCKSETNRNKHNRLDAPEQEWEGTFEH